MMKMSRHPRVVVVLVAILDVGIRPSQVLSASACTLSWTGGPPTIVWRERRHPSPSGIMSICRLLAKNQPDHIGLVAPLPSRDAPRIHVGDEPVGPDAGTPLWPAVAIHHRHRPCLHLLLHPCLRVLRTWCLLVEGLTPTPPTPPPPPNQT